MVDQTLPEIRQVQEINKAKRYEQKQKEKKDKMETIKNLTKKLNLFCGATDRASDNGFKYLYMDKADKLIKEYKYKLQEGKNKMKEYNVNRIHSDLNNFDMYLQEHFERVSYDDYADLNTYIKHMKYVSKRLKKLDKIEKILDKE